MSRVAFNLADTPFPFLSLFKRLLCFAIKGFALFFQTYKLYFVIYTVLIETIALVNVFHLGSAKLLNISTPYIFELYIKCPSFLFQFHASAFKFIAID